METSVQKFLITGMAAGLLCPLAAPAQSSLAFYGVVETGIQRLTNADTAGGTQTGMASGIFTPSRWGVRGQEDLGGGAKAFFRIETGFNTDTGTSASSTFFNRYSELGLGGRHGTLTLGRTGSVKFDKTVFYDPLNYAGYSGAALGQLPTAYLKINNAVKYQSPSWSGFNVEVMHGLGQEVPGNRDAGTYTGAAIEYAAGGLSARATAEQVHASVSEAGPSHLADRRASLAAAYRQGAWHLFADYTRVRGDLKITPAGDIVTLAAGWQATPSLRLVLESTAYRQRGRSGPSVLWNALAEYRLSRRTALFAAAAHVDNRNGTRFAAVYPGQMALANASQTGVTVGVSHRF